MKNEEEQHLRRFEAIDQALLAIRAQLEAHQCTLHAIDEAESLSYRISRDQRLICEALSQCWKGADARRLILGMQESAEQDLRRAVASLENRRGELAQKRRSLQLKEDELQQNRALCAAKDIELTSLQSCAKLMKTNCRL